MFKSLPSSPKGRFLQLEQALTIQRPFSNSPAPQPSLKSLPVYPQFNHLTHLSWVGTDNMGLIYFRRCNYKLSTAGQSWCNWSLVMVSLSSVWATKTLPEAGASQDLSLDWFPVLCWIALLHTAALHAIQPQQRVQAGHTSRRKEASSVHVENHQCVLTKWWNVANMFNMTVVGPLKSSPRPFKGWSMRFQNGSGVLRDL